MVGHKKIFDKEQIENKHRETHIELHKKLDELAADFSNHTGRLFEEATILELMIWSYEQTIKPSEKENKND